MSRWHMHHSRLAALFLCSVLSFTVSASVQFIELVNPYLEAKLASKSHMYTYDDKGHLLGLSPEAKEAKRIFNKILNNKSPNGDKALAYLLFIYVGSGPATELLCEVVNRGNKMVPIIELYMESLPKSSLGSNIKTIQINDAALLARRVLKRIKNSETCEFSD